MTLYCSSKNDISVFVIRTLDAEFRQAILSFRAKRTCAATPDEQTPAGAQPTSERASFTDAEAVSLSSGVGAES